MSSLYSALTKLNILMLEQLLILILIAQNFRCLSFYPKPNNNPNRIIRHDNVKMTLK